MPFTSTYDLLKKPWLFTAHLSWDSLPIKCFSDLPPIVLFFFVVVFCFLPPIIFRGIIFSLFVVIEISQPRIVDFFVQIGYFPNEDLRSWQLTQTWWAPKLTQTWWAPKVGIFTDGLVEYEQLKPWTLWWIVKSMRKWGLEASRRRIQSGKNEEYSQPNIAKVRIWNNQTLVSSDHAG